LADPCPSRGDVRRRILIPPSLKLVATHFYLDLCLSNLVRILSFCTGDSLGVRSSDQLAECGLLHSHFLLG
jgi:hypothetical protein